MWKAIDTVLWSLHVGAYTSVEQPPSAVEYVLGEPSFRTNATDHGHCQSKQWLWWQRHMPAVSPSLVVPPEERAHATALYDARLPG
eukprot:826011-Pleurochrysis_carterae.AAC.1